MGSTVAKELFEARATQHASIMFVPTPRCHGSMPLSHLHQRVVHNKCIMHTKLTMSWHNMLKEKRELHSFFMNFGKKRYGITKSEKVLSHWLWVIGSVHFQALTFVSECYCSPTVYLVVGIDFDSKELHSNGLRNFGVSTLCERRHGGLCCLICFLLVQCACERTYAM